MIPFKFVHIPKTGGVSIWHAVGLPHNIGHYQYTHRNLDVFSFCVFRDPVERFISAFTYLKNGGQNYRDKTESEEWIGDLEIGDFVETRLQQATWVQQHFRPQVYWIPEGVDRIFCFNNLNAEFKEKFGIDLPRRNVTKHKKHNNLTQRQIQRIRKIYQLDQIIWDGLFSQYSMFKS